MTYQETFPILNCPRFEYSGPWSEMKIIHDITYLRDTRIVVVGDPGWASYEWVHLHRTSYAPEWECQEASNAGYGISEIALRDALSTVLADE